MEKALKITAIVLFILIMGFFVVQFWLGNKIASVIEEKGSEFDGGAYHVEVGSARINLFARSVTISNVRMKPDTTGGHPAGQPEYLLDVAVDGIFASGFNLKMIRGKEPFKLTRLEIDRPIISADVYGGTGKEQDADSTSAGGNKPFNFPTRRLVITDGAIVVRQHKDGGHTYTEADDINIDIRENSSGSASQQGLIGAFAGSGSVSGIVLTNADASVDTIIDTVRVDLGPGNVSIAGVTVTPRYPKETFVYKSSRHRDWTHLWARDILVSGIDVTAAGNGQGADGKNMLVTVDSVHVGSGLVESYKDRNAHQPYWVRKLIYESVSELPVLLTVRQAVIGSMDAVYSELPKMGTSAGIINFTNLSGTVTGLSNVPSADDPYWTLAANGFIYGAAPVSATFYFPKDEKTNRWEARGLLGRLDLRNLNKTIIPLAKAEVESGTVDEMDFHLVGNSHTASVEVNLLYDDLKVDLVKFKGDHEIKERRFLSWLANEFVIKDSNPSGGETRHGSGTAERELDRSQFNFLWKTLVQGIKEVAGL